MKYVTNEAKSDAIKFFRTQSPRHFEGGDWDQGGSCPRSKPLLPEQVRFSSSLEMLHSFLSIKIILNTVKMLL